jgi:hypothetical protein
MYTDTPLPQEEPAGQNPPDGAVIDYYLSEKASNIGLDIIDIDQFSSGWGKPILYRHYSNMDTLYKTGNVNIPDYWIRPQQILSAKPGHHRFMLDMKYAPLNIPPSYPIAATFMNTAPDPTSPWLMPGKYLVRLTVDDKSYSQLLEIKMDPRVKISAADLQKQHDLSLQCYEGRKKCTALLKEVHQFRTMLQSQLTSAEIHVAEKLGPLEKAAALLENTAPGSQEPGFGRLNNAFASIFNTLQDSDSPPTSQAITAAAETQKQLKLLITKWDELKAKQSGH